MLFFVLSLCPFSHCAKLSAIEKYNTGSGNVQGNRNVRQCVVGRNKRVKRTFFARLG
jgi:hypothetical protein